MTTASDYDADAAGLISGFVVEPAGAARAVDCDAAAAWLADRASRRAAGTLAPASGFLWLHFNLAHTGAVPWLRAHAAVADEFFESLESGLHSTRIERSEAAIIAVVNDVHFDFMFEPSDTATLWIGVDADVVVSARREPLRSVDKLRAAVRRGEPLRSPAHLLERLLRAQADVLVEIVRGVTERIDTIEDRMLAGRLQERRARLGVLRRLLVRLQRLLAPEPGAFLRVLQRPPAWMTELDVDELRQSSEEFAVVLRDMATLQERIKLLQEEIAADVQEGNNRSLFVLTIVTVLALPINIVAGLLGMNVGGIPLAQHAHGFWIVVAIVASFTVLAAWLVARRWKRDR